MAKAWDAPGPGGRQRWYDYADAVLAAGFRRTVQGEPTHDEREAIMNALLDELGWDWDEVPEEHIPSTREILGDMADRVLAVADRFRPPTPSELSEALEAMTAEKEKWRKRCAEETIAWADEAAENQRLRSAARTVQGEPNDALRDAISHIHGAVEFQDAINPEAIRVVIDAALRAAGGASVQVEPEWEYGVKHIAVDDRPNDEAHISRAVAARDLRSCGWNCKLIRRRPARDGAPAGPWVPVQVPEGEEKR